MNRAKRLQYAIALGQVLGWIRGKADANVIASDAPGPDREALKDCERLLDELKRGYAHER